METKFMRDLCVAVVDCPHSTPVWTDSGKIVIRNFNIQNGKINFDKPSYTDEFHYLQRVKRAIPTSGDIVITREAPMGQVGMIPEGVDCCLGQRMVLLKVDREICDPYYLLYALQSPSVQFQIHCNEGTGTTVSNLRIPVLEKLKIPYVGIEKQKEISSILRKFDEKIEVNNKIIKNLYNQIKICADELLSDCNDSTELSLSDICDFVTGYSYKSSELVPSDTALVTIKNFNREGGFSIAGFKPIKPDKKTKEQQYLGCFDIIVAHTDLTQKAEIIGNAEMILDIGDYNAAIASMDLVKVIPKNNTLSKSIVFAILKSRSFKQHCLGYVNGTTVLHLSKNALPRYTFRVTNDKNKIKQISDIVDNATQMISVCMKANKVLSVTRDKLLPKLLSGEIELNN